MFAEMGTGRSHSSKQLLSSSVWERVQVKFLGNLFRVCCKQTNIIEFIHLIVCCPQFASKFEMGTGIKNKNINFTYGNLGHLKLESEELTMAVEPWPHEN